MAVSISSPGKTGPVLSIKGARGAGAATDKGGPTAGMAAQAAQCLSDTGEAFPGSLCPAQWPVTASAADGARAAAGMPRGISISESAASARSKKITLTRTRPMLP